MPSSLEGQINRLVGQFTFLKNDDNFKFPGDRYRGFYLSRLRGMNCSPNLPAIGPKTLVCKINHFPRGI